MPEKPRILAQRVVAESRIFRIEQLDLKFSNGSQRTYERILGGRDSVMIAAMPDAETVLLARDLFQQCAEGDEPEPIEVIPWRLDQLDALLERDDFSEARSIAGIYLVNRFLASIR